MGTEKDYARELMDARADLRAVLSRGLGAYLDDIMASVDRLITLETDCVRAGLRAEAMRNRKHEVLVREARATAARLRSEARVIRGEEPGPEPRSCSGGCGRNVRDNPEMRFYENKKHPEKLRSRCTDCEKAATRENTERRRAGALAAGLPWPPPKVRVTAGKVRSVAERPAKPEAAPEPAKPERHLKLVTKSS